MTPFDPPGYGRPAGRHHRRSIRLKGYDYTQPGAYFVTICTYDRVHLFGAVVDGEMRLNEWGEIVRDEWFKTAQIRPYVQLRDDEFVAMPNHMHGIIWIFGDDVGATRRVAPTPYETARSYTAIHRRHHRTIQIRRYQTHQRIARHPRRGDLATQLLRTHHPR